MEECFSILHQRKGGNKEGRGSWQLDEGGGGRREERQKEGRGEKYRRRRRNEGLLNLDSLVL